MLSEFTSCFYGVIMIIEYLVHLNNDSFIVSFDTQYVIKENAYIVFKKSKKIFETSQINRLCKFIEDAFNVEAFNDLLKKTHGIYELSSVLYIYSYFNEINSITACYNDTKTIYKKEYIDNIIEKLDIKVKNLYPKDINDETTWKKMEG